MGTFTRVCVYCRREFEAAHLLANICALECQQRFRATAPSGVRSLSTAASALVQPKPETKIQSTKKRRASHSGEAAKSALPTVQCVRCRKPLVGALKGRTYCSAACRNATRHKKRRALIRRVRVEPISLAVLRQRDADTCRICGLPIDFEQTSPHPLSPTIDHVVALAKGGKHGYENTQLAHLRCNLLKGAD